MVNLLKNFLKSNLFFKLINLDQDHKGDFSVNVRYGWSNN